MNTMRTKPRKRFVPIGEFIMLLERYNRRNGTRYSYGQAVSLLESGMIPRYEFYLRRTKI